MLTTTTPTHPVTRRTSRLLPGLATIPMLLALVVIPRIFGIMPAVQMKVVDAHDGTPIAGVAALFWGTARAGTLTGHGSKQAVLFAVEAVSNASGELGFPKQTFRSRPFFLNTNYEGPSMLLLKPGYAPLVLHNTRRIVPTLAEASIWEHDGKTAQMRRATVDDLRRQAYVVVASTNLMLGLEGECSWKQVPRALVTADRMFPGRGTMSTLRTLFLNDARFVQLGCGSPKAFFGPYLRP